MNNEKRLTEFLDDLYEEHNKGNREIRTVESVDREIARLHRLTEDRSQSAGNKRRLWKQIDNLLEKRKKIVDEEPAKKPRRNDSRRVSKKNNSRASQK